MAKKIIETIEIKDFIFPNKGIGFIDGSPVEVKNALPGEKVSALIYKKRGTLTGTVLETLAHAPNAIAPLCSESDVCGGCTFQRISYEEEAGIKHKMLMNILNEADINCTKNYLSSINLEFVMSNFCSHYRNKMEYSFGDMEKFGNLALGMRKKNSYYEVCNGAACTIAPPDFSKIVETVILFFRENKIPFYHKKTREGILRHLIIRQGYFTNEIIVNLVTAKGLSVDLADFSKRLRALSLDSEIVGILHTENESVADVVKADTLNLIYGRDYFYEKINGLTFKITPFSFFQTNSRGAEILYNTVKEFAGNLNDTVFDLYCGTGTIAQILAENAKKVIGIEIVPEATAAANENMELNGIRNVSFITGDVLEKIKEIDETPSLIILDPPREGIHPKAIGHIINFSAEKIIYISCKPTSFARDLNILMENGYKPVKIRVHDMFPRSYHMETVCLLEREGI